MCAPVEPAEPTTYAWGSIRWIVNADLVPGAGITVGLVEIGPGLSNPLHFHPNAEEVLHLLEGSLDHRIGDGMVSLVPGTTIHVPQGVHHQATNTGTTPARMVVTYPTGSREMVVVEAP